MRDKFTGLTEYADGQAAEALFARLRAFGRSEKPELMHHAAHMAAAAAR